MRLLKHIVLPEDDGREIKRVIRARMGVSHHQFTSLKQKNAILLDDVSVHANHVVKAGQTISIELEDEEAGVAKPVEGPVNVVYEDEDILIINKDAPLSCMSGADKPGDSLENRLAWRYRHENYVFRPVNRLDKGTSGLMAVAKHAHAQQAMQRRLHSDDYIREYRALVVGCPDPAQGTIDAPIGKADGATVRREIREDGQSAVTHYETLWTNGRYSLLKVRLETGRTHQIRVHLSSKGWPIVGDFLYGEEDERLPYRFALHSCYLSLIHPVSGEKMVFEAEIPEVFTKIMEESGL